MDQAIANWPAHSVTAAPVRLTVANNTTWSDAYQFDEDNDTTWTFDGQEFELDVQRNPYDQVPLLSCSTANGRIVVDDPVLRVLHFNVAAADIQANLDPGVYVYDLVMVGDGIRVALMYGTLEVVQGVTYPGVG